MVPGGNDFVSGIVSGPGATGTGYNFGETNLPPVVSIGADLTATFCGAYNFKRPGFFTDAAQDGAWTGTVDYGDGTGVQALALSAAKTFQLSHTYNRAGLYSVVVTIRDGFGQSAVTQMLLGANRPMPQAFPKLVTLNDDSAQRSMVNSITVTFDQVMVIDSGAFEVRNAAGVTFPVRTVQRVINGKTVVVLEFTDRLTGGSLADGDYVVRIDGSKVHTLSNAVWNNGGVYAEPFFRFFGDADGDRDVDNGDLIAIQAALRSTRGASTYREQFDYDSDCDVDATDYNQFLARYRRTL
ncbi:MAG: PKD domain-containing protein [Gemmataceae bacterium]